MMFLDAYVPGQPGGTGELFDWSLWPGQAPARLVVAGGLAPDNVAAAVQRLRPYGVDVASGVEAAAGIKDEQKMIEFIREVRRVQ